MTVFLYCLEILGNHQSYLTEIDSETNSKGPVLARGMSSCHVYVEFKTVFKLEEYLMCDNSSSRHAMFDLRSSNNTLWRKQRDFFIVIFVDENDKIICK